MNYITKEQATQIAAQFAEDATYEFNIANAAIQHYLDQRKAELPEPVAWLANYGGNVYTEAQLKQAVRDALELGKKYAKCLMMNQAPFDEALAALAQQELPQKERHAFMAGYDAGMADAKRMAQQGEPVCSGCGIPAGSVHMSTCKSGKWPSRVSNGDTAAPAPQPAQSVPETNFGNMPVKFLVNGTRFKLSFDTRGRFSSLWNFMDELDGRWVALVAAEDDCHLQSAQPPEQKHWRVSPR